MKYILVLLFSLLILGCEQNSEEEAVVTHEAHVVMRIGTPYVLEKGDVINKDSDDAQLKISKNSKEERSYVTLLKGSAHIDYKLAQ